MMLSFLSKTSSIKLLSRLGRRKFGSFRGLYCLRHAKRQAKYAQRRFLFRSKSITNDMVFASVAGIVLTTALITRTGDGTNANSNTNSNLNVNNERATNFKPINVPWFAENRKFDHHLNTAEVNPSNHKTVLVLDGGGLRGCLTVEILKALEKEIRTHDGFENAKLCDMFDLIVGTSTGTINIRFAFATTVRA